MPDGQERTKEGYLTWDRNTRAPSPAVPPGSCDCQFHIFESPEKYPPKEDALYHPPPGTFQDMRGVLQKMGFQRGVIVHAMPYDTDHRLLIDTLESLEDPENIRATAIIKDHVGDAELEKLDRLGVCAARFNIGRYYKQDFDKAAFFRSIDRAREIGWHARLHVAGHNILDYAEMLESIKDITVSIDHMGHLDFSQGMASPLFQWILDRIRNHGWWLMLSNGSRLSKMTEGWDDAVPFGQAYVEAAPDRLIWGTDWPHVVWRKSRMPNDAELVELLYRYVDHDIGLIRKILVDNAARLHGFADQPAHVAEEAVLP